MIAPDIEVQYWVCASLTWSWVPSRKASRIKMNDDKHAGFAVPKPGPMDIVVYHVGGDGGIGPVESLFEAAADNVLLVVFEIRDDEKPFVIVPSKYSARQVTIKVNRAIDETSAVKDFYVTNFPLSSSLYKPSPMGSTEDPGYFHCKTWGENCEVQDTISVKTASLQDVIEELSLPAPDVISSDAQGAELGILKGAGRFLRESALAVVTEVEFSEIYHRQPLFDEQMALLSPSGFRLVNLFNSQVWQPGPRMGGNGFLTVAEAVFVKYFHDFGSDLERPVRGFADMRQASTEVLLKMCTIALGLRMMSYAVKILRFLRAERSDYQQYVASVPILQTALVMAEFVEQHQDKMDDELDYFVKAFQFNNSPHLKFPVPDTSTIQWHEQIAQGIKKPGSAKMVRRKAGEKGKF